MTRPPSGGRSIYNAESLGENVIPAKAGTHDPFAFREHCSEPHRSVLSMGPGFRRDDGGLSTPDFATPRKKTAAHLARLLVSKG
jgi:hypothetical protein